MSSVLPCDHCGRNGYVAGDLFPYLVSVAPATHRWLHVRCSAAALGLSQNGPESTQNAPPAGKESPDCPQQSALF